MPPPGPKDVRHLALSIPGVRRASEPASAAASSTPPSAASAPAAADADRPLRERAVQLLAQREHSRAELGRKLADAARRAEQAHLRRLTRHRAALAAQADEDNEADVATGATGVAGVAGVASATGREPRTRPGTLAALASDPALPARIERVLDRLSAQGLLDESRFVESRVHQRRATWGLRRLQIELQSHGVTMDGDTRQQLAATEAERAQALWQQRFGQPPADPREALRQMRFLAARGFAHDVVSRTVPRPAAPEPSHSLLRPARPKRSRD
jgi:regulatory protein